MVIEDTKYCQECGTKILRTAENCPFCGARPMGTLSISDNGTHKEAEHHTSVPKDSSFFDRHPGVSTVMLLVSIFPLLLSIFFIIGAMKEGGPGAGGTMLFGIAYIIGTFLYWVPIFVADRRSHKHFLAIAILNITLGTTGLGWIGALIWAVIPVSEQTHKGTSEHIEHESIDGTRRAMPAPDTTRQPQRRP